MYTQTSAEPSEYCKDYLCTALYVLNTSLFILLLGHFWGFYLFVFLLDRRNDVNQSSQDKTAKHDVNLLSPSSSNEIELTCIGWLNLIELHAFQSGVESQQGIYTLCKNMANSEGSSSNLPCNTALESFFPFTYFIKNVQDKLRQDI